MGVRAFINSTLEFMILTSIQINTIILIILWLAAFTVIKYIGKRLERVRKQSLLTAWLIEIGSDIRIYGVMSVSLFFIAEIAELYIKGSRSYIGKFEKILLAVWIELLFVSFVVQSEEYMRIKVTDSITLLEIDKRNYLTLIPVIISIVKVISYVVVIIICIGFLDVDVRPLINIGTIVIAALTFAGSDTIKSVISTLKIFLTRKYYVGSYVRINGNIKGLVKRITVIDTTVVSDDGVVQIIENDKIVSIFIYPDKSRIN